MSDATDPFSWLTRDLGGDQPADDPETQRLMDEQRAKEMEFSLLVHEVFMGSPRGPELLQHLRDATIELSLFNVGGSIVTSDVALSPADWAHVREGQNSIVRFLETHIRLAMAQPEKEQEQ